MRTTVKGWLFDLYPSIQGMTLWIIDEDGKTHRCRDTFTPVFYLHLPLPDMARAEKLANACPVPVTTHRTQRMELYSGTMVDVLACTVHNAVRAREAAWFFEKEFPHFTLFNTDIPIAQLYLYHTQLFPLAFGEYCIDDTGQLTDTTLYDTVASTEYRLPPLSIMALRNTDSLSAFGGSLKHQRPIQLEISYDNTSYMLEQESPADLLEGLNRHLTRCDPDILLTEYGDSMLMPMLHSLSHRTRIPLLLNRDRTAGYHITKGSSYFQYGKIIHKDGAFELAGRWHIDAENSFTVMESDLDGLFELSRITQIPVQRQSRASIGNGLSSMQFSWAYRNAVLIPSKKREPEEFKSAATLILADRGGLTFQPPIGYHEDVGELDFVSMYPTIMVQHNVSPETVNCRCCPEAPPAVPELDYRICVRREGIVPATLRAVVARRLYYKKKKKELKTRSDPHWIRYDRRQTALKWMLVTCFGYLGYKNARFGKIEAHESVNAFSRDALLTAKEIAERNGFRLLHAIVDSMWLKKPGATEQDYERLCDEISAATSIDISLEGIYRWILFPASRTDSLRPTANRYIGWYRHGEYKVRGIEVRRHDTPKFIKEMQRQLFDILAHAQSVTDIKQCIPDVLNSARSFLVLLRSGTVTPLDLVIRKNISQEASEYSTNSVNAVVARMLEHAGIHLAAGESISYILIDSTGKNKPEKAKPVALYAFEDGYDIEKYSELCLKAVETLLLPFGWDMEKLTEYFGLSDKNRKKRGKIRPPRIEKTLF